MVYHHQQTNKIRKSIRIPYAKTAFSDNTEIQYSVADLHTNQYLFSSPLNFSKHLTELRVILILKHLGILTTRSSDQENQFTQIQTSETVPPVGANK